VKFGSRAIVCRKGKLLFPEIYFMTSLCHRYWEDEHHTKQTTRTDETDGKIWMCTGDEGIMDEEGYVRSMLFLFTS
jgi:acyl-coenzyme A synthetase/AMP-(fatty) acid ligase